MEALAGINAPVKSRVERTCHFDQREKSFFYSGSGRKISPPAFAGAEMTRREIFYEAISIGCPGYFWDFTLINLIT
ncbi:MAG: hypothetical protein CVU64_00290 [Deltaproteobacteria bacterium HGW-Deltaproteobacteria-21]|nr:MAG: hypothetical protein CVU64_00290 [Deltaproteobacteria bacterium HGW-Deltaproteobacteria-21]